MASKNYQPLQNGEDNLDDNNTSQQNANPASVEESAPIIQPSFSLSDSEDDNESVFEDTLTNPLPSPISHPLQLLPLTECIQLTTPISTDATEEEKPEAPQPRVIGLGNDGVFANLAAKPEARAVSGRDGTASGAVSELPGYPPPGENEGDANTDGPLPDYDEAMQDPSPPHFDDAIGHPTSLSGVCIDDLLVEGLPVGGILSFIWNGLISEMFPYIGFLLTYLLHINHAGRLGSFTGLGLTFLMEGFRIQNKKNNTDEDIDISSSPWFSYLLMVLGWIIILKSVTDYIRLRRERHAILSSPESGIVPSSV